MTASDRQPEVKRVLRSRVRKEKERERINWESTETTESQVSRGCAKHERTNNKSGTTVEQCRAVQTIGIRQKQTVVAVIPFKLQQLESIESTDRAQESTHSTRVYIFIVIETYS